MWVVAGILALTLFSGAERRKPPQVAGCSRDDMTSFTGRLETVRRAERTVEVRMKTDWDSTERLRIARTVAGASELKAGARITLWVCGENRVVKIDRLPPKE